MELAAVFNPTTNTSGSFTVTTLQTGSTMIVMNKSYVDLIFTFANGDRRLVIANDRRAFQFSDASVVANGVILWAQENIDYPQTINQLENVCYVEVYAPTEKVVETYPTSIQRETLPSLIPYNIGYSVGVIDYSHSTNPAVIWPSSYYGVTTAPQVSQFGTSIEGMGFDYFWTESNMAAPSSVMTSLPGNYSTTQKNTNNATLNNPALASNIPGPFSQPGLTPVDSATHLNSTYWQLSNLMVWPTTFFIDGWFKLDNVGGRQYFVLSDDVVTIAINSNGTVLSEIMFSGGTVFATSTITISSGIWYYVSLYVSGTNVVLYINGIQAASTTGSGTINTPATHIKIGASNSAGNTFIGSIANVGILLTNPFGTPWGVNTIQARYLLGQQSLNVDMQNAWITEIELIHQTGATATTGVSSVILEGVWNPGGQLYANVPVNANALHIWRNGLPNSPIWSFSAQPINSAVTMIDSFQKPLTHVFDSFPILDNSNIATAVTVTATVRGYNILGIG